MTVPSMRSTSTQAMRWVRLPMRAAMRSTFPAFWRCSSAMAGPGELGNITRVAEETRPVWTFVWLEQLYRDVRYALRTMLRNRGFTATALLSLALGIGANTAIFSLIDALMMRWLPVHNPQELVHVTMRSPRANSDPGETFSHAIVKAVADEKEVFAHVCGFNTSTFDVGPNGAVHRVAGAWVTGDYYETFGLTPAFGRLLAPSDDQPGAPAVAVLSYDYWQRAFASNPAIVGQPVSINGVPVVIAGVSGPGFTGATVGTVADITLPVAALPLIEPLNAPLLTPSNFWLRIIARPQPNVSVQQVTARLAAEWPHMFERVIPRSTPEVELRALVSAADWQEVRQSQYSSSPVH